MVTKKSRFNKLKIPAISLAVLAVIGLGAYLIVRHYHKSAPVPVTTTGVNLAPATEQEKQESAQSKENLSQPSSSTQPSTPSQTSSKKQVNVVITHAGADSVNAYVTGVFEDGGTCSATFTQGSTTVNRTSNGFANVSYTQCAPITPNLPNAGSWSVVVSYSSTAAEGKSQAQTF